MCVTEIKITLLSAVSWTKSDKFEHRFGSKTTLIGCTGSVLVSRFRQTEFESCLTQGYFLLFKLKIPKVKCENVKKNIYI